MRRYTPIGLEDHGYIKRMFSHPEEFPLSGYLAGKERGGVYVENLETDFARIFNVRHAIACNSATSGLLAAAFAVDLGRGDTFACPAMTMSATVAAPMFTGAVPYFCDVEERNFGLMPEPMPDNTKAIFTTNLFGHASVLARNDWDSGEGFDQMYLIEDNSQSPLALAHGRYCGTFGTIGVFSFNVHKHLQCGEGGMIVTNDDTLAHRLRDFINHGENAGGAIGLNLRMPEICAALALVQLRRGFELIDDRINQAQDILSAIGDIPGIRKPVIREGCTHVYYVIPFLMNLRAGTSNGDINPFTHMREERAAFCAALREEGIPIVEGYQEPLYRLPAFKAFARRCPVAEDLQDNRLFYFENCSYSPSPDDIRAIGDAFRKAAKQVL